MAWVMARIGLGKCPLPATAVAAGAEADPLGGVVHIGPARIILPFESGQMNQYILWGWFAGQREIWSWVASFPLPWIHLLL